MDIGRPTALADIAWQLFWSVWYQTFSGHTYHISVCLVWRFIQELCLIILTWKNHHDYICKTTIWVWKEVAFSNK